MTSGLHADVFCIDRDLVSTLISAQFPQFAALPLRRLDAFEWLPAFRDLVWHDDGTLTFVSHDPALGAEAGDLHWRFDPVSDVLTIE